MHPLHDIPAGPNPPERIYVIVEIPKGSRNKYELEKDLGFFKLDRTLYSPMNYPGDYGLIPRSHYDDGDPLDALIICNEPTFTGCVVECRPLGIFRMLDKGAHDDKVLCVPVNNPYFREFTSLEKVPTHFLDEVAHFFSVYKDLEGSRTVSLGWHSTETAHRQIMSALHLYEKKRAEDLAKAIHNAEAAAKDPTAALAASAGIHASPAIAPPPVAAPLKGSAHIRAAAASAATAPPKRRSSR